MRLSTDPDRSEERAAETVAAAVEAGITVFDTARAYGLGPTDLGHNERLLARLLRACGAADRARVVTKGGMARPGGGWAPDGRAKAIRADCEASLAALDGIAPDLYLLHAPDPRTPWRTSVRALARLVDDGLVARVGVANVARAQLDEALALAPIAAVSVPLSPFDDRALRGGVVERCADAGIAVIAHSPLGGPRRAGGLARRPRLAEVAAARGLTAAEVALAWLLDLAPVVVPLPGARRPGTARSAAAAASIVLDAEERRSLAAELGTVRRKHRRRAGGGEAVIVMGIPGAGKTLLARGYVERGYERLNRDERGGTLRALASALDDRLAAGARRLVLDNTYLTRAARSHVVDAAGRHGLPVRCVWLRTPLAQAQVNMVERLLERFGALPGPEELREAARREPWLLAPTAQMRALRELEPPALDEGFAAVEEREFAREPAPAAGKGGVLVAAAAFGEPSWRAAIAGLDPAAPHLVFDWAPDGGAAAGEAAALLAGAVAGPVEHASCPHPGGPPRCWCRPPLPGLALAFCRAHGLDPARCTVVGTTAAHRTLAATLGARRVEPDTIGR